MVQCLIDPGADASFIPLAYASEISPSTPGTIVTSTGSTPVLGTSTRSLSLGLTASECIDFPPHTFRVADLKVECIIIGTDFILDNRLDFSLIDSCLIQRDTGIILRLQSSPRGSNVFWLNFIEADHSLDEKSPSHVSPAASADLSPEEQQCLQLLQSFENIVQSPTYHSEPRHNHVLDIVLTKPLRYPRMKPRQCSLAHQQIIDDNFKDLEARGAAKRGTSAYASPITIVSKKDGSPRICVDYTRLNQHTADLQHAIPSIRSLPQRLNQNHHWFSTVDLKEAYYSLPLTDRAAQFAAIVTQHGSYVPSRTMFGLKNAPSKFCELIADMIQGLESFVFAYLDDFIIFSTTFDEHLHHLEQLFCRIDEFGLFVNTKKCSFAKHSVTFLGHTFSMEGMHPLDDKVQAIKHMPPPTNVKEVRRFLGCINYYRPFLPHLAEVASPLTNLLSVKRKTPKTSPVKWGDEQQHAFDRCIQLLVDATALNYEDHTRPLVLCTDASLTHAGATLEQVFDSPQGEVRKPLAFFSKKFAKNVAIRSTFNRELTAAYFAVRYFRYRIAGRRCTLKTDHKALVNAINNPSGIHSPIEERMLQFIKEFSLDVQHVDGDSNHVADYLSRPAGASDEHQPITSLALPDMPSPESHSRAIYTALCSTSATSKRPDTSEGKQLTLEIICAEQQKEPLLMSRVEQALATMKTKPQPEICQITTTKGSCVYGITSTDVNQPRVILPTSLRVIAFHNAHDILHQGQEKTLDSLSFQYFWPEMQQDIQLWVKACPRCQSCKISRHNRQKLCNYPTCAGRFRVLHIDLVSPSVTSFLPHDRDSMGFRYILTMRERATGFVLAEPIRDKRTTTIMWTLLSRYIAIFGPPDTLVADNGMEFASGAFHKFCTEYGIVINHTTAYHPQSNGAIERVHRDLKVMIRSLPCTREWAQHLPLFAMAYNNQACDINVYTSFQHVFGQAGRLPEHILSTEHLAMESHVFPIHTEAFMELMSWHRRKARPLPDNNPFVDKELDSCAQVWVRNSASHNNVAPLYTGPFDVISKGEKYFVIKQGNVIKPVSIDRLKTFFPLPAIEPPTRYNLRSLNAHTRSHQRLLGKYAVTLVWFVTTVFSLFFSCVFVFL